LSSKNNIFRKSQFHFSSKNIVPTKNSARTDVLSPMLTKFKEQEGSQPEIW